MKSDMEQLGRNVVEGLETRLRLRNFADDWDAPGMEAYDSEIGETMSTVTRVFETNEVAQYGLVGKVGDELIANWQGKVVKIGAEAIPVVVPKNQKFTAGAVANGKIVCSVVEPRKAQYGSIINSDGSIVKMDAVPVKKAGVIPFFADADNIFATVADGTTTKRTALYSSDGKLNDLVNEQVVGAINGTSISFEQSFECPEGFGLPIAARASGQVTVGQMYLNGKRIGANACSWAKVSDNYIWMVPNGALGCDRFVSKSFTADGVWFFGLAYQSAYQSSAEPFVQVNVAFNASSGTWHSFSDLFGVDLSFADLVIDGDVVYGRASDGIYKVEGWR